LGQKSLIYLADILFCSQRIEAPPRLPSVNTLSLANGFNSVVSRAPNLLLPYAQYIGMHAIEIVKKKQLSE